MKISVKNILDKFNIKEAPKIILNWHEDKFLCGYFDAEKNVIVLYSNSGSCFSETLIHELAHYILFKQGSPYLNHTKKFFNVEKQIYELLGYINKSN